MLVRRARCKGMAYSSFVILLLLCLVTVVCAHSFHLHVSGKVHSSSRCTLCAAGDGPPPSLASSAPMLLCVRRVVDVPNTVDDLKVSEGSNLFVRPPPDSHA